MIDLKSLVKVYLTSSKNLPIYIHDETYEVRVGRLEDCKHWLVLPDPEHIDEYGMSLDFIYTLEKESYQYMNSLVHEHGEFKHFLEGCHHLGITNQWLKFKENAYEVYFEKWCKEHNLRYDR